MSYPTCPQNRVIRIKQKDYITQNRICKELFYGLSANSPNSTYKSKLIIIIIIIFHFVIIKEVIIMVIIKIFLIAVTFGIIRVGFGCCVLFRRVPFCGIVVPCCRYNRSCCRFLLLLIFFISVFYFADFFINKFFCFGVRYSKFILFT